MLLLALLLAPPESGPAAGARPAPYSFLVATGPERGRQTCYICAQEMKPGAIVFTRRLTPEAGRLFARLDAVAANAPAAKGFKLWATHLGADADLDAVAGWARNAGVRVSPAGVYDDPDGPPAYKLAPEADVTLLVFANKKVVTNLSLRAGELTDSAIQAAVAAARKVAE